MYVCVSLSDTVLSALKLNVFLLKYVLFMIIQISPIQQDDKYYRTTYRISCQNINYCLDGICRIFLIE